MRRDLSASLLGWGTARADLAAIAAMRKKLPTWAPPDTPGHFLKYADEQTVLAVAALDRFGRGGGPAISPHVIPQHSLHSISGALSILLASRQPNFGIGGTAESLAEGLLAALTFPANGRTGTLLV